MLLRVARHLRFAPGGTAIGIDMNLALILSDALGYDAGAVIDLLPAGEAGLLEGFSKSSDEGDPSR